MESNQNFLVKSIRILVEITRIPLINIIILVQIRILVDFTRNIVSNKIPVISIRIRPFSTRILFQCSSTVHYRNKKKFRIFYTKNPKLKIRRVNFTKLV